MEKFDIIAKTVFGMEEVLAAELETIGASNIEILRRAVKYRGDKRILYKSNLHLRTAIKILKPFATFPVHNDTHLYEQIKRIEWDRLLGPEQTFAIDGVTSGETFTHSKYVALKAKDAIADQFRENFGERPSVDVKNPDLRINVHIADETCTVSLDSSGTSLNKRGYRTEQTMAPLSEVLAAGILLQMGWKGEQALLDPMCGSGTFLIEAGLIARNIPPGKFRHFSFEKWNDFDYDLWGKLKQEAKDNTRDWNGQLFGGDQDHEAIEIARSNAQRAGVLDLLKFEKQDFTQSSAPTDGGWIVMNPPYGERLDVEDIIPFYKEIGNTMKSSFSGWDAWIISANLEALKFIGLRPSRKIKLFNGSLECRLNKYELYRGSKKASKNPRPA